MLIASLIFCVLMMILAIFVIGEVKSRWARLSVIPAFLVCFGLGSFVSWNVIGLGKPYEFAFGLPDSAELLETYQTYDQKIWMWVLIDGVPVSLEFPWDAKLMETVQATQNTVATNGGRAIICFRNCGKPGSIGSEDMGTDNASALGTVSVMIQPEVTLPPKE